jgi:hypothetical protein
MFSIAYICGLRPIALLLYFLHQGCFQFNAEIHLSLREIVNRDLTLCVPLSVVKMLDFLTSWMYGI